MPKSILVTGGTKGIGKAIVDVCQHAGHVVHIIASSPQSLNSPETPYVSWENLYLHEVDLTDPQAIDRFMNTWQGDLYGLVNNAGTWSELRLDEPEIGTFDRIFDLNVKGLYHLTKGLLGHIQGKGRIINISSQLGTHGRAGMGAYTASKHAVNGFTKSWAPELAGRGITVNSVGPGWIDTHSNRRDVQAKAQAQGRDFQDLWDEIASQTTLGRWIQPSEVAALVAFLLSKSASGITGQIYNIN